LWRGATTMKAHKLNQVPHRPANVNQTKLPPSIPPPTLPPSHTTTHRCHSCGCVYCCSCCLGVHAPPPCSTTTTTTTSSSNSNSSGLAWGCTCGRGVWIGVQCAACLRGAAPHTCPCFCCIMCCVCLFCQDVITPLPLSSLNTQYLLGAYLHRLPCPLLTTPLPLPPPALCSVCLSVCLPTGVLLCSSCCVVMLSALVRCCRATVRTCHSVSSWGEHAYDTSSR